VINQRQTETAVRAKAPAAKPKPQPAAAKVATVNSVPLTKMSTTSSLHYEAGPSPIEGLTSFVESPQFKAAFEGCLKTAGGDALTGLAISALGGPEIEVADLAVSCAVGADTGLLDYAHPGVGTPLDVGWYSYGLGNTTMQVIEGSE
jgi:hypothetical protein